MNSNTVTNRRAGAVTVISELLQSGTEASGLMRAETLHTCIIRARGKRGMQQVVNFLTRNSLIVPEGGGYRLMVENMRAFVSALRQAGSAPCMEETPVTTLSMPLVKRSVRFMEHAQRWSTVLDYPEWSEWRRSRERVATLSQQIAAKERRIADEQNELAKMQWARTHEESRQAAIEGDLATRAQDTAGVNLTEFDLLLRIARI